MLGLVVDGDANKDQDQHKDEDQQHGTQLQQQVTAADWSWWSCASHSDQRCRPRLLLPIIHQQLYQ